MDQPLVIIEVVGEGATELGKVDQKDSRPREPVQGVLPILLHRICGEPPALRVIPSSLASLGGGSLKRKVDLAMLRALNRTPKSDGVLFVIDTEGGSASKIGKELQDGREEKGRSIPTAVGVAHPCIEAWLLADSNAVSTVLNPPEPLRSLPTDPESLPAPGKEGKVDSRHRRNPKTTLGRCGGENDALAAKRTWAIAKHADISCLETVCPISFKPLAEEVRAHLLPLFSKAIIAEIEPESTGEEHA